MTTRARPISPGRYFFDLESIYYVSHIVHDYRRDTERSFKAGVYQLLYKGENIEKKEGKHHEVTTLKAEITFDSVKAFNEYANGLAHRNVLQYVQQFLTYYAERWSDSTLKVWSASLKYKRKKQGKKAFTVKGQKADISHDTVRSDLDRYYQALIEKPKTLPDYQKKKQIYRNLCTILFGITTGMRSKEMNRLTWEDINDYKREYDITFEDGSEAFKPKDCFIISHKKTKTKIDRVTPIHPDIQPYLTVLETVMPNKPFDTPNFKEKKKLVGAEVAVNSLRNFAAKYFNDYGLDEFRRLAIMGHDESKLTQEMKTAKQRESEVHAGEGVSKQYRQYSPKDLISAYLETVGKNLQPVPEYFDLEKIKYRLKTPFKEQK